MVDEGGLMRVKTQTFEKDIEDAALLRAVTTGLPHCCTCFALFPPSNGPLVQCCKRSCWQKTRDDHFLFQIDVLSAVKAILPRSFISKVTSQHVYHVSPPSGAPRMCETCVKDVCELIDSHNSMQKPRAAFLDRWVGIIFGPLR